MLGRLVGRGNTADVFDIGRGLVIKLFKPKYPINSIQREFQNSRLLESLGLPIAKSHRLVTRCGRHGIIYDKIDGQPMLGLVLTSDSVEGYARDLARLQKKMLSHRLPQAISLKTKLQRSIESARDLRKETKSILTAFLRALQDAECCCHGDFHFGNIMVTRDGYFIIDYMNLCSGHQYGDIARTLYLTEMSVVPAHVYGEKQLQNIRYIRNRIAEVYLEDMGVSRQELSKWLVVTAAARLSELTAAQTDEKGAILQFLSDNGF